MAKPTEFLYDVAFSFLSQDEPLAVQLNELLKDRRTTFLYSDAQRQAAIAGRDGAEMFTRVFGRDARTVVVLYRTGWGTATFTAIEATAIRNRAHEVGFDFTTFISLDKTPMPEWLPRTRLWVGLDRWGLEHAATVIESRVQEAGGESHEENAAALAARTVRERLFADERIRFLASPQGVAAARQAFEALIGELERISQSSSGLVSKPERFGDSVVAIAGGAWRVTFSWQQPMYNTLQDARIHIRCQNSHSEKATNSAYSFDVAPGRSHGWRSAPVEVPHSSRLVFFGSVREAALLTTAHVAEIESKKLIKLIAADTPKRR